MWWFQTEATTVTEMKDACKFVFLQGKDEKMEIFAYVCNKE